MPVRRQRARGARQGPHGAAPGGAPRAARAVRRARQPTRHPPSAISGRHRPRAFAGPGGSSDLYHHAGRPPTASINFVTAHDGFTLLDLVSYNDKHNQANGENNQDGDSTNRSWNCGVEGESDDPAVRTLRAQQQRNLLTTLLLSQGVPMLLGGGELGRTQKGNNNVYCQDNELSWLDWANADQFLLAFTRQLIAFRQAHPVFRQRAWFRGRPIRGLDVSDISWFAPSGEEMNEADWRNGAHALAHQLQVKQEAGVSRV